MIVSIPVYLSDRTVDTKVEIQIRTVADGLLGQPGAQDPLQIRGQCAGAALSDELVECAGMVSASG